MWDKGEARRKWCGTFGNDYDLYVTESLTHDTWKNTKSPKLSSEMLLFQVSCWECTKDKKQKPTQPGQDVQQIVLVRNLEAVTHKLIENSVSHAAVVDCLCSQASLTGDLWAAAIDHQSLVLSWSPRSKEKNERGFGRALKIKEDFVLKSPSNPPPPPKVPNGTRHSYSSIYLLTGWMGLPWLTHTSLAKGKELLICVITFPSTKQRQNPSDSMDWAHSLCLV